MAASIIPDGLWKTIKPLLPPRPPSAKGGRPPIGDREVLTGIIFVLRTGIPWEELPPELGCGCGMTCLRRLRSWQEAGVWREVQSILDEALNSSRPINWKRLRIQSPPVPDPNPALLQAPGVHLGHEQTSQAAER